MNNESDLLRISRRELLRRGGAGFGMLGLATLLSDEGLVGSAVEAAAGYRNPLAPRPSSTSRWIASP